MKTTKKQEKRGNKHQEVVARHGQAPKQYPDVNEDGDDEFYFDDCAICQGMKKAKEEGKNLSIGELTELFQKQNSQN